MSAAERRHDQQTQGPLPSVARGPASLAACQRPDQAVVWPRPPALPRCRIAAAASARRGARSEESRVGKESVSTCRSRGSQYHYQKKTYNKTDIIEQQNQIALIQHIKQKNEPP